MERRDFIKLGLGAAAATALPLPDVPRYRPEVVAPYAASDIAYATVTHRRIPTSLDECFELMDKEELYRHLRSVTDDAICQMIRRQNELISEPYLPSAK
jgi:hypothetical protein